MLKILIAAACIVSLTACAQFEWRKYGATQAEFNLDAYNCQTEAARLYPAAIVSQQLTSGYTAPATTNCTSTASANRTFGTIYATGNTNCTTTPGAQIQPITYTTDANSGNRAQAASACMYARGYHLVRVK